MQSFNLIGLFLNITTAAVKPRKVTRRNKPDTFDYINIKHFHMKKKKFRDAWMAQGVERLPSAQGMVLGLEIGPMSGSL